MQPVRSRKNQYRGVNAHLHSYWQAEGGWSDFHARHIVHLVDTLKPLLLPMGYTAAIEPSIQIRRLDDRSDPEAPESDLIIYQREPTRWRPSLPQSTLAGIGELVLPIADTVLLDQPSTRDYRAIKIYALHAGRPQRGEPIAWLELLSPSNKPGGRDAQIYLDKRVKIIENGIVFLELDYLHESAPTLRGFPSYRIRRNQLPEKDAHPYRILIIDPRPDILQGMVRVREFDVDEPIPTMTIPLTAGNTLTFDFCVPYRKTFEEALFGLELVDYGQLPVNFNRYSKSDQARIVSRILSVLAATQQDLDLENGPFPVQTPPLEVALAQLERLQKQLP